MMNLSMSHPVPNFGDSFTITCYVCGMPSSKEWAQKARSRPTTPMKPYYPFLLQITPIGGALLREDGSTYLCAFCHASLEAQWNIYETQQVIPPPNRKYNIQKFICAVCGVETYRKRIRALPFQEFPFLEKQRQSGSITLGNNPLAVVCLDCSETLWAQSAEYDRWGLPVHKRHFNWMARPPPPEDSVEATVARLPSGETQLPRCPPIEPAITPSKIVEATSSAAAAAAAVKHMESQMSSKSRSKGKGDSPKLPENSHLNFASPTGQGRKSSLTSTTPPTMEMVGGFHSQQPPVVTVAPMSNHTTVISLRKDSLQLPPGLVTAGHQSFPQSSTSVYPPAAAYTPYVWGNPTRESGQRPAIEPYPYNPGSGGAPGAEGIAGGPWPWIPHPSSDLLRYQSYVTSLQNRSRLVESSASGSPTHRASSSSPSGAYGGSSPAEPRYQIPGTSSSTVVSGAMILEEQRQVAAINSERSLTPGRSGPGPYEADVVFHRKGSPDPSRLGGKKSPKVVPPPVEKPVLSTNAAAAQNKLYPSHPKKVKEVTEAPSASTSAEETSEDHIRHIPKKRNWQQFMKESQALASPTEDKVLQAPSPAAVHHPHPKKKKSSLSECSYDGTSSRSTGGGTSPRSRGVSDSAMDLSVSVSDPKGDGKALKGGSAGAKFRIEYLCQSTTSTAGGDPGGEDPTNRTSVIKCAPKVKLPSTSSATNDDASQEDDDEEIVEEDGAKIEENLTAEDKPREVEEGNDKQEERGDKIDVEEEKEEESKMEVEGNDKEEGNKKQVLQEGDHDDLDKLDEDLPNLEQFLQQTVLELVSREKARASEKAEEEQEQKEFLEELGLITPDKKIDLEIKSIVSRHERKTLPPLQLRPEDSPLREKIGKQLKELLLQVSLQDPTLFEEKPEADQCDFMAELGMKTAETSEKTRREVKWRVILMERMRREIRNCAARGVKHEWEKSDIFKKFAKCDLESFFGSLSYAALQASEEEGMKEGEEKERGDGDEKEEDGGGSGGVCINYPKYIPSYAVAGPSGTSGVKTEENSKSEEPATTATSTSPNFAEPILKIPVVPPKRRLQSESSSGGTVVTSSDTDDSEATGAPGEGGGVQFCLGVPSGPYPLRIDNLVQCSTSYWQQMKRSVDEILNDLESGKEDVPVEDKTAHLDKLRKHLKSQLNDIKEIEKRFRATGKAIQNSARSSKPKKGISEKQN